MVSVVYGVLLKYCQHRYRILSIDFLLVLFFYLLYSHFFSSEVGCIVPYRSGDINTHRRSYIKVNLLTEKLMTQI